MLSKTRILIESFKPKSGLLSLLFASFISVQLSAQFKLDSIANIDIKTETDFETSIQYFKWLKKSQDSGKNKIFDAALCLQKAEEGLSWAVQNGNAIQKNEAKFYALRYNFDTKNQFKALELGFELLKDKSFRQDYRITRVTSYIKRIYLAKNDYTALLEFYPTYDKMNRLHGRIIQKSDYINDFYLGWAFYGQKNYEVATKYFKQFAKILIDNDNNTVSIYNDIGLCYAHLNQWDSANTYFNLALERIDPSNPYDHIYFRAIINSNKADYYIKTGSFEKAIPYYEEEFNISKSYSQKNIIASAFYNMANIQFLQNNYSRALVKIDSAVVYMPRDFEFLAKTYRLRALCYAAQGASVKALKWFNREQEITDSLELDRVKNHYIITSTQYEVARKESDLTNSKEKIKTEKKISRFRLIGLFILGAAAILIFLFYRKAMKDKRIIGLQKKEAQNEADEKSILLKEVHHRVKNNLQVISGLLDLQASKLKQPAYYALVKDTQQYIQSMSLVHEMLYQNKHLAQVNIQEYLSKLSSLSSSSQVKKEIDITVESKDIELPLEQAMPLGLILTELISNSFKHGFKETTNGKININVLQKEDEYEFNYKDNGIGLSDNFSLASSKTLGFRLLRMFAEEMRGKLTLGQESGFTIKLNFKLSKSQLK